MNDKILKRYIKTIISHFLNQISSSQIYTKIDNINNI